MYYVMHVVFLVSIISPYIMFVIIHILSQKLDSY